MLDQIAAYRTSQVMTASPAGQIVLLYQGAIRQGMLHLAALDRRDIPGAHAASVRAQEIGATLQVLRELLPAWQEIAAQPLEETVHPPAFASGGRPLGAAAR